VSEQVTRPPPVRRLHHFLLWLADRVSSPESPLRRRLSPLYSAFLDLLTLGRGFPADINGQIFRIDPRFRWSVWHAHERAVAEYLASQVKPGQCCFDVGANIGIYVLQLARWSAPDGRIVAFEPNPATLDVLHKHVEMNGLDLRVTVVPLAAGWHSGQAQLYDSRAGSGLSRLGAPHAGIMVPVEPTDVPMTTIDDFCRQSGIIPDWILIDVEGYEYEVLLGAAETLRRYRPRVVVELHAQVSSEAARAAGQRLLSELGLTPVVIPGAARNREEEFVTLEPSSA
jgi:FkbM family methyltransferase